MITIDQTLQRDIEKHLRKKQRHAPYSIDVIQDGFRIRTNLRTTEKKVALRRAANILDPVRRLAVRINKKSYLSER